MIARAKIFIYYLIYGLLKTLHIAKKYGNDAPDFFPLKAYS